MPRNPNKPETNALPLSVTEPELGALDLSHLPMRFAESTALVSAASIA